MRLYQLAFVFIFWAICSPQAIAQGAEVAFGPSEHDTSAPVEIVSDKLALNRAQGTAKFTGNVIIAQGDMRLTSDVVDVWYGMINGKSTGKVARVLATGNVTFVSTEEAAESDRADYSIETGIVVMTGDVILTQGANALSSERLVINIVTGVGVLEGRVKSILQSGEN